MTKLIIRNVGPIKDINIELNKINVIIGPQSSGKSTINKIACFCSWVEKKVSLEQSFNYFLKDDNFISNLTISHKLDGYFHDDSEICYESSVMKFSFKYSNKCPNFEWINQYDYIRTKISYIPAERNIVSMIYDWKQVNLPKNNIFNFMSDWNMARKAYTLDHTLDIKAINTKYYYDESQDIDFLETPSGNKIQLINASSGQQSMIPLYILLNYFTETIYNNKSQDDNIENKERDAKLTYQILMRSIQNTISNTEIDINDEKGINEYLNSILKVTKNNKGIHIPKEGMNFVKLVSGYFTHFIKTNYTSLYIEEPELNLFPSTQKELLYYILNIIQQKDHKLFITTHSPYILYALNNCMMGWLVKDNMPEEIANSLESYKSWIDPKLVSAWQINDGQIVSIQEKSTKSIGKHYFNKIMNETMNEYYTMLNYFNPNDYEK